MRTPETQALHCLNAAIDLPIVRCENCGWTFETVLTREDLFGMTVSKRFGKG